MKSLNVLDGAWVTLKALICCRKIRQMCKVRHKGLSLLLHFVRLHKCSLQAVWLWKCIKCLGIGLDSPLVNRRLLKHPSCTYLFFSCLFYSVYTSWIYLFSLIYLFASVEKNKTYVLYKHFSKCCFDVISSGYGYNRFTWDQKNEAEKEFEHMFVTVEGNI